METARRIQQEGGGSEDAGLSSLLVNVRGSECAAGGAAVGTGGWGGR